MTLTAHRLLEAITTRESIKIAPWVSDTFLRAFSNQITRAEKFDFGRIDFDTDEHGWPLIPELTDDEWDFWSDGLIVLPANPSWYEYDLIRPVGNNPHAERTGMLVSSSGNQWTVFAVPLGPDKFLIDGTAARVRMREGAHEVQDWSITTSIASDEFMKDDFTSKDLTTIGWASEGNFDISVYLTLMLNSRTTEKKRELAPPKLNRNRERRRKPPLFDHNVVRIVPERWLRPTTNGESDRRSPRLHWRRSHLRHYDHPTPHSKQMGADWVVAIPRQLVGRAEVGSTSHEYRVYPL